MIDINTLPLAKLKEQVDRHPYPLMFATISGAHLYGFPSPDSDFDLRGIHVLPLADVIGLNEPNSTVDKSSIEGGLEIDLVTHDALKFCKLMLRKNGYVLEQIFSPLIVHATPEFDELKSIAADCITRHHSYHYNGFARGQWKLFRKADKPLIKPLLYTYRVLMTGINLMRTGKIEANLATLNEDFQLPAIDDLVRLKMNGKEKEEVPAGNEDLHEKQIHDLLSLTGERVGKVAFTGSCKSQAGVTRFADSIADQPCYQRMSESFR